MTSRTRLTPDERRRQLIGIGLRAFVEHPVQDVSLDAVAAEAGVSRGLLFHYFPTKTDFHAEVARAAMRRVLRTISPDEGTTGEAAVAQVVERFVAQVVRRREAYVALIHGQSALSLPAEVAGDPMSTFRQEISALVAEHLGVPDAQRPILHAWVAYLEDLALQASAPPTRGRESTSPEEATRLALDALTALLPSALSSPH